MPLTALIFDMGDVFYDATPWRRGVTARLAAAGVPIDFPTFVRRWEERLVDVYLARRDYWDAFRGLLADFGLSPNAAADLESFARKLATDVVEARILFPGVAETLPVLKRRGLKLAVLSDTESREPRVRAALARLGIESQFDAVLTSVDIGHVKPERAAYQAALDRLAVPAAAAAFVGHDAQELAGASAAGLTAIAFNYEAGAAADHYLARFEQLLELVPPPGG